MKSEYPSVFDIERQGEHLPSKIVVALERISEIFRVLLWEDAKVVGLSPLQIQLLIFIKFHSPEKSKVTYLAEEFGMTKATISNAVKNLIQKEFLEKEQELSDRRSFYYTLTENGSDLASKLSQFAEPLEKQITGWNTEKQSDFYQHLLSFISESQKNGFIKTQRMCFNCRFYRNEKGRHYCTFLKSVLPETALRIDCGDFEKKSN